MTPDIAIATLDALTLKARILLAISRDSEARQWEIHQAIGGNACCTERAVQGLLGQMKADGVVVVAKQGRRASYKINRGVIVTGLGCRLGTLLAVLGELRT